MLSQVCTPVKSYHCSNRFLFVSDYLANSRTAKFTLQRNPSEMLVCTIGQHSASISCCIAEKVEPDQTLFTT